MSYTKRKFLRILFAAFFLPYLAVHGAGTYSDGRARVKLIQFESRGVVFESYEGSVEWTFFDAGEECAEEEDACFSPVTERVEVSVRPENVETVNFLRNHLDQEILIHYRIHRFEPVALSTDFEILEAREFSTSPPDVAEKMATRKTGGKRNFSVFGKILRMEYQGTLVGTYEGIYLDETSGRVHPFSITEDGMADYVWNLMPYGSSYYLGISVAYVTGMRESDYDLFEVNLKEAAGGVEIPINDAEE